MKQKPFLAGRSTGDQCVITPNGHVYAAQGKTRNKSTDLKPPRSDTLHMPYFGVRDTEEGK